MLIRKFACISAICALALTSSFAIAKVGLISFTGSLNSQETKLVPTTIPANSSVRLLIYPTGGTETLTCKFSDVDSDMITFQQSHKPVCVVNIKSGKKDLNMLSHITNDQSTPVDYRITITDR